MAAMTGMAAARPRATRSRSRVTNSFCCCSVPSTVEYRAISSKMVVMTVQAVAGFDLAAAVGEQPGVAVVHHLLQPAQGDDGVVDVGADELVGDVVPHAELDVLAVEQHQAAVRGQGGVGGDDVQQAGLAAAGFACGEQVLVDDPDVDAVAEFVDADVDRVEHGQHAARPGRCPR